MTRLAPLAIAAVIASASGCGGCDTTNLMPGESSLATNTEVIQLGRVYIGATARATFILSAPGDLPVNYTSHFEGRSHGHQVGPATGRLPPNGAVEMLVIFRPNRPGNANAKIVFESNATRTATVAVEIRAAGLEPPDCQDGNGCTEDSFDLEKGECVHAATRVECNDFNACTDNDTCVEGVCLGGGKNCDDNDICTDDLCEPAAGCVHLLTATCNDNNPCTRDLCDPTLGCQSEVLADGTPCDDLEQCTIADICLRGECIGVTIPEGTECTDGNPCSKLDQCIEGMCRDPTYVEPGIGDLRYVADVGPLAEGASLNPIIDRDSSVYVGVEDGVTAIDLCGETLWTNRTLGTPRWSAAVSLPGLISVPIGSKIVDVETIEGDVLRELDLAPIFPPLTSSTSTATVRILDVAMRSSGALVVSIVRETVPIDGSSDHVEREGMILEVDRFHTGFGRFRDLGASHASRLAIDNDEAVIAILREGAPDKYAGDERLVRFGLEGLPETSWSTTGVRALHTELAFGPTGEVLWTHGLLSVGRRGELLSLVESAGDVVLPAAGSPVVRGTNVILVDHGSGALESRALGVALGIRPGVLTIDAATGAVIWRAELAAPAPRMSPAVDLAGNVYLTTADGVLHAFDPAGAPYFETVLPLASDSIASVALGITPRGTLVAVAEGRVFGVQSVGPLSNSSWPRHRRDNLATGHR